MIAKSKNLAGRQRVAQFSFIVHQIQVAKAQFLSQQYDEALYLFKKAYQSFGTLVVPLFYDFLCQEAEALLEQGEIPIAIQIWQDIATIMQADTPEHVYHRMSHCYSVNKQGFGGTKHENHLFGDYHKHDLLEFIHNMLEPEFYFEIGVDEGLSLARAQGRALGVDARPDLDLKVQLPDTAEIIRISSDGFFKTQAQEKFTMAPDVAFIDGMHLFEFALRDFINLERYSAPYTLIGIDDIFPCHPIQAERRRQSGAWTGDVWKLIPVLQRYRPDLTFLMLDCYTTGLLLISGLDASNRKLENNYEQILNEYQIDLDVPNDILQRVDSVPSDHYLLSLLLDTLKRIKTEALDVAQAQKRLQPLRALIDSAKNQDSNQAYKKLILKNMQETRASEMTLYWRTEVSGYVESHSVKSAFELNGQEQSFELALPEDIQISGLRFDIAGIPGYFSMKELTLIDRHDELLWSFSRETITNIFELQVVQLDNNKSLGLMSTGSDPRFELVLAEEFISCLPGSILQVRFIPSVVIN